MLSISALLAQGCGEASPGTAEPPSQPQAVDGDGYEDPAGTGLTYILDVFQLSEPGSGLDIDDDGDIDGVVNRAWQPVLPSINEQLQAGVYSGRTLFGIEMAGVRDPYEGQDPAATLKLYDCYDPDGDPTNNFCDGPDCGRLAADPNHIIDGQTEFRSTPTAIVDEYYEAAIDGEMVFEVDEGVDMQVQEIHIGGSLPVGLHEIYGVLCAVSTARDLNKVILPICEHLPAFCQMTGVPDDLTVAEYLVVLHFDPDIDLDGDGLERYVLDAEAQVTTCFDADDTEIPGTDCLEDPRMADGFSLCFDFHAIPATIEIPTE